jgi:transposase
MIFRNEVLPDKREINPLNPELNPICYLLALLVHHFLHVSRIRVKATIKFIFGVNFGLNYNFACCFVWV